MTNVPVGIKDERDLKAPEGLHAIVLRELNLWEGGKGLPEGMFDICEELATGNYQLYMHTAPYVPAINTLGYMYENGAGTEKDSKKAFKHYKLAKRRGSTEGACNVARCYENGIGTSQNIGKAFVYYQSIICNNLEPGHNISDYSQEIAYNNMRRIFSDANSLYIYKNRKGRLSVVVNFNNGSGAQSVLADGTELKQGFLFRKEGGETTNPALLCFKYSAAQKDRAPVLELGNGVKIKLKPFVLNNDPR